MQFGQIMASPNKSTRIKTLHILIMLYTGCSRNKAVSFFHGAPKIFQKVTFRQELWVNSGKSKTKIRTLYILEKLYTGCSKYEAITVCIVEHLKFKRKMAFADALQINRSKLRQKNYNKDTKQFEIARLLHKRSKETASFAERLKFHEKVLHKRVG